MPSTPREPGEEEALLGFLKRVDGTWAVLVVGANFNPAQLAELGIPQSILPDQLVPEG